MEANIVLTKFLPWAENTRAVRQDHVIAAGRRHRLLALELARAIDPERAGSIGLGQAPPGAPSNTQSVETCSSGTSDIGRRHRHRAARGQRIDRIGELGLVLPPGRRRYAPRH